MRASRDLTGHVIGRVTVRGLSHIDHHRKRFWNCRCECGTDFVTTTGNLRPDHTVSCGCYRVQRARVADSYLKNVFRSYIRRASRDEIQFELSLEQVETLIKGNCRYCAKSPVRPHRTNARTGMFPTNGIDRVDNAVGYLPENCVSCCVDCNLMKKDMTEDAFREQIRKIYTQWAANED